MKHKIITLAIAFIMVCTVAVVGAMAPTYADEGAACTHEKMTNIYADSQNPATCISPATYKGLCSSCGWVSFLSGDPLGHNFAEPSLKEQGNYIKVPATCTQPAVIYKVCTRCKEVGEETYIDPLEQLAKHTYKEVNCLTKKCTACGKTASTGKSHTWTAATCTTPKTCKVCGATEGDIKHTWKDATCTAPKTCEVCKLTDETDPAKGHNWKKISCTKHECIRCHTVELMDEPEHNWVPGDCKTKTTCANCKETTGELLEHTIEIIPAVPSTCMSVGVSEGQKCSVCNEILKAQVPQGRADHTLWYEETMPATTQMDGEDYKICKDCYYPYDEVKIPKINKVKMTETFVYTGKAKKPKVTVYDSKGKVISSKYYKVTYKKNTAIGTGTANIKFSGKYYGTITKEFQIVPKATTLSKLTKGKKAITVKWTKGKKGQVDGYEVQLCPYNHFRGSIKTYTVKGRTKTSYKATKLSAKKKYYVRIRTYKTIKVVGRDVKIYSAWSKVKYTTTKK